MKTLDSHASAIAGAADPAWLGARRKAALDFYDKLDMPSDREEVWRYVDLDFTFDDYALVDRPGEAHHIDTGIAAAIPETAGSLRLVDGHATSVEPGNGDALFGSLRASLADNADQLEPYVARGTPSDLNKFAAAHTAFGGDGAVRLSSSPTSSMSRRPPMVPWPFRSSLSPPGSPVRHPS